jgi:hypothetical protein
MNLHQLLTRSEKLIVDNAPAILTGTAMVGTVATGYLAAKAAYKSGTENTHEDSLRILRETPLMTTKEKVVANWLNYAPAVGVAGGTLTCVFFANRINARRAAALMAVYSLTERRFDEYKEHIFKTLGGDKATELEEEVIEKRMKRTDVPTHLVMSGDDILCFDDYSARYFRSNTAKIEKAVNETNFDVIHDRCAKLSDFWDRLGLDIPDFAEELGWTENSLLEVSYKPIMSSENIPTLMISYEVYPIRRYNHRGV